MPSLSEHRQIESDLSSLASGPSGNAPATFLIAVRARRRVVLLRRVSAVMLGAIVVLAGVWLIPIPPSPSSQPAQPVIAKDDTTTTPQTAQPDTNSSGAMTLASFRRLYTQPDSPLDLLATLPASPHSAPHEPPLRLKDTRLLLAEGL